MGEYIENFDIVDLERMTFNLEDFGGVQIRDPEDFLRCDPENFLSTAQ